jgi:hypothetical protein
MVFSVYLALMGLLPGEIVCGAYSGERSLGIELLSKGFYESIIYSGTDISQTTGYTILLTRFNRDFTFNRDLTSFIK